MVMMGSVMMAASDEHETQYSTALVACARFSACLKPLTPPFPRGDFAQQRRNGQALQENGRSDYRETDGDNFITERHFERESERERERECAAQSAPKQEILVLHFDA